VFPITVPAFGDAGSLEECACTPILQTEEQIRIFVYEEMHALGRIEGPQGHHKSLLLTKSKANGEACFSLRDVVATHLEQD
jgi:hypothetical protein